MKIMQSILSYLIKLPHPKDSLYTGKTNRCLGCGGAVGNLETVLSEFEYENSGYCQRCQNNDVSSR